MNKLMFILIATIFFLLVDFYVLQGIRSALSSTPHWFRKSTEIVYWSITAVTLIGFYIFQFVNPDFLGKHTRTFVGVGIFMNYFSKTFFVLFLLVDDLIRLGTWSTNQLSDFFNQEKESLPGKPIPRSEFLTKTGLIVSSIPIVGMTYGIISGAHDYRVRKQQVFLPNLPSSFDGIKIAQISDIHSGSFFNKKAVMGGVEMILNQKPDIVLFTGDLVNNRASEVKDYINIFEKVKAPLGVYSVLGNHDYGDYVQWESPQDKQQNLKDLIQSHKIMGWDILMNEHRTIKHGGDELAIIGIENWSAKARFPKYGKLQEAQEATQDAAVKLLLSHDPSHWDAQVRSQFKDIDIMFAGHTHGMQFGIEIPGFRWSPVKYMYKQWAGLYQEENQYLYVNRGFGYLGYPGRIGMPPEITILELKKA